MKSLNQSKTIKRNYFTRHFSPHRIGRRKILRAFSYTFTSRPVKRTGMQRMRRSKQGAANQVFGSITALQIRRTFGRFPTISPFWR
jgi:hypothetical protein